MDIAAREPLPCLAEGEDHRGLCNDAGSSQPPGSIERARDAGVCALDVMPVADHATGFLVGIDIGGTFTDCVVIDRQRRR